MAGRLYQGIQPECNREDGCGGGEPFTIIGDLGAFARNRAATIQAVETADEGLFARPIRSAGGVTGSLATVFFQVAVLHVLGHARDVAGAGGG